MCNDAELRPDVSEVPAVEVTSTGEYDNKLTKLLSYFKPLSLVFIVYSSFVSFYIFAFTILIVSLLISIFCDIYFYDS